MASRSGELEKRAITPIIRSMNVVYNSENYYVLEYPEQHSYEVVDKNARRGAYFSGDMASRFRASILHAINEDPSVERIDEFLAGFGGAVDFPMTVH